MKKKINRQFTLITIFSIIISTLVMAMIFYSRLKAQVFSDLEIISSLLLRQTEDMTRSHADYDDMGIRITVVEENGNVLYDTFTDADSMENHFDRPEIKSALEKGCGKEIRISNTLSRNVFYYAVRMENGHILRVGKEYASVLSVMVSAFPVILGMVFVLIICCMAASHYLAIAIIEPINHMARDLNHIEESEIYEELVPFARKIRSQHEEILSAANMRRDFTANVSHELKTPLAAISGYAELIESGVAKEEDTKHFSTEIRKSADRLLHLINDILKLSSLDAGYEKEMLDFADLSAIAGDTVEMISVNADKMGVSLSFLGCEAAMVRLGRELAEEVTYNLIENAIRYNKRGGTVSVTVSKEDNGILFQVSDTGIGIDAKHQERIFERFYRVDKSRSKELGGTGLGLAIVKHICDLTEGKITLESELGKGTTVSIFWGGGKGAAPQSKHFTGRYPLSGGLCPSETAQSLTSRLRQGQKASPGQ